jgi:enhancing lycopene biosynthesis protein 2
VEEKGIKVVYMQTSKTIADGLRKMLEGKAYFFCRQIARESSGISQLVGVEFMDTDNWYFAVSRSMLKDENE